MLPANPVTPTFAEKPTPSETINNTSPTEYPVPEVSIKNSPKTLYEFSVYETSPIFAMTFRFGKNTPEIFLRKNSVIGNPSKE